MYLDNKYTTWYNITIENAKIRVLDSAVYTERHHIVPKSLGGTDLTDNIVVLTAKEHFICHLMLPKMVTGRARSKMVLAIQAMCRRSEGQDRYIPNATQYELIRTMINKNLSGVGSPTYGRKRPAEEEIRRKATRAANALSKPKIPRSDAWKKLMSEQKKGKSRPPHVQEIIRQNFSKNINHNNNEGKKWYNDGVTSYLKLTCPVGCVLGRLPLK
jgi:hypothetical protein